jgi:uncharacterized protein (TIGR03435 family)
LKKGLQTAICCPCGNEKILALGLCATCYTLKRQDAEYFGGLREQVLERDGYACRVCGDPDPGVHHREPGKSLEAPDWAYSDRFDISAKTDYAGTEAGTDHGTSPTDEKDHIDERNCIRLQALLADRFHLKVRFDSKMMPVLVMTSVKGSKLKASSTTSGIITSGFGFVKVTGATPAAIAAALAGSLQEQVVDETGLGGSYDFDLKWKPDTDVSSDESGTSIYTAVKEQLGLQLRPEKRIGPVLVVERAEKPTAN